MPISVVIGGQYGSEGKGKVAHWLAKLQQAKFVLRVGGSNSGHTVLQHGRPIRLQQLPTAAILKGAVCVIPAGGYITLQVLLDEVAKLGISRERLLVHPAAVLVDECMKEEEERLELRSRLGSTGQGIGAAVSRRVLRDSRVRFASDEPLLQQFVRDDLGCLLANALASGERVLVEGTQGFGLSLLHGGHYPFATSRDTTAAGALSEAGLSPLDVDCIALVIRAFPIRVAGNSGPLRNELSWRDVALSARTTCDLTEYTTVTNAVRRVGKFDSTLVMRAIEVNRPNLLVLNHADYFDFSCHERTTLSPRIKSQVRDIEATLSLPIDVLGTGPGVLVPNSAGVEGKFVRLRESRLRQA